MSDESFNSERLMELRTFCEKIGMKHSLYMLTSSGGLPKEINHFLTSYVKKVFLLNESQLYGHLTGHQPIQPCRFLTHLTLCGLHSLHQSVLSALSLAVKTGHLPQLTHLSFALCDRAFAGKLHIMFACSWPTLSYLNLYRCRLDTNDLVSLSAALETLLPSLSSLVLSIEGFTSAIATVFQHPCFNLSSLFLHAVSIQDYEELNRKIASGEFSGLINLGLCMDITVSRTFVKPLAELTVTPINLNNLGLSMNAAVGRTFIRPFTKLSLTQLTLNDVISSTIDLYNVTKSTAFSDLHKLDISESSGISGSLSILLCHRFAQLAILILSHCGLTEEDLRSLAKASVKCRLPKLRYLDLSNNRNIMPHLDRLFEYSCTRNELYTLYVDQTTFNFSQSERPRYAQLINVLCSRVKVGTLSSLRKIRFTALESNYFSGENKISWPQLQHLDVVPCETNNAMRLLENLADAVEKGLFPALKTVRLATLSFLSTFNPHCFSQTDIGSQIPPD